MSLPSDSETEEDFMDLDTSDTYGETDNQPEYGRDGSPIPKKRRPSQHVLTEKLVMLLDRCNISDRNAMRVIYTAAEAFSVNTSNIFLSRSTIRNQRQFLRQQRAEKIKNRFKNKELEGTVVHWDGKLLPSLTKKENVDRLAILVSNGGEEQLLGVPPLESGTGSLQAEAVAEALNEWGLKEKVVGMCFDTTASNTGRIKGACALLEKALDKDLLYLACRHHMLEVVLRAVFDVKMGSTTGPQPEIFKRFQTFWSKIDQNKYQVGIEDQIVQNVLNQYESEVSEISLLLWREQKKSTTR